METLVFLYGLTLLLDLATLASVIAYLYSQKKGK